MRNIKSLHILVKILRYQEERLAKDLHNAKTKFDAENSNLVQLQYFEKDYINKFIQLEQTTLEAVDLKQYHNFIEYLENTIKKQIVNVQHSQNNLYNAKLSWFKVHQQNKSLKRYIKDIESSVQDEKNRIEQKELDATATDIYNYRFR